MGRRLFGTDGVRGLAGKYPLDKAGCIRIGKAVAAHFVVPGQQIVVACDPRQSSEEIVKNVIYGISSQSVNVVNAGVMPTPALAYLTREHNFAAGVMITASHNPAEYNGIKVFDGNGDKLNDVTEVSLNGLIESEIDDKDKFGEVTVDNDLIEQYVEFVRNSAPVKLQRKVVIDCANGASSSTTKKIFSNLVTNLTVINDQPNGTNINKNCGATNTKALSELVITEKYDLGVAFDGDADRIMLIDSKGRELNGDYILYILSLVTGAKGIVTTIMSNIGLDKALNDKNIKIERVAVGDRYVLEGMQKTGYSLGGEQAGHIIMGSLLKTGDGTLTAAQLIKALSESDKSLEEWRDELKLYPQALVNISLHDKDVLDSDKLKNYIELESKVLTGKGRLLIRPSGTEPLVRVMVEATDAAERADRIATELKELIN